MSIIYFGNEKVNFHKVWDNCFGDLSGEETIANTIKISNRITVHFPAEYFGDQINNLAPVLWSKEGYDAAVHYAYATQENQKLDEKLY